MKKLETKLKQLQNAHSMSMSEKTQMRNAIKKYMELKPVIRHDRATRLPISMQLLWQHKLISATLVLAIFFTSGAGAVYASTDALPGERLYRIKEITEELHERILISDVAKVELVERLTKRREQELRRLEELGKLDDTNLNIINIRMRHHKQRVDKLLKKIESESPERATRIKSMINKREDTMQQIKIQRANRLFNTYLLNLEEEYDALENLLQELDQDIKELDTIIPNI
jgi:hypothetical protein